MRRGPASHVLVAVLLLLAAAGQRGAAMRGAAVQPRSGVVWALSLAAEALDALGPVWYYSYGYEGTHLPGHQRLYLVPPGYSSAQLRSALRQHPTAWWLVGNEPNDPHQDDLSPGAYAALYHRVSSQADAVAPGARVAPAGIANADWRWAEAFREAYRVQYGRYPRVDAWNIHNYVLEPERDQLDVAEFQRRILAFREWMARIGEANTPLLLTEFGVLYGTGRLGRPPEDPARVVAYIEAVVAWLRETDHVQGWSWFASYTEGQFNGDLYDELGGLTRFGEAYQRAIGRVPDP